MLYAKVNISWDSRKDLKYKKNFLPVVMIADLIAAGLQEGYKAFKRPTMPEM
jgi:hypothetical protein